MQIYADLCRFMQIYANSIAEKDLSRCQIESLGYLATPHQLATAPSGEFIHQLIN